MIKNTPSYLQCYSVDKNDPIATALQWFRDARFGLFIHYGLYSLLGRHEWVQFNECIPVREYTKLKEQFTAERFDADFYAQLAVEAGMKYINITTRHHDGFCLFNNAETDFNSVCAPKCQRDLVQELAVACDRHGLGLCLYYAHGRDWRHPHSPNNQRYGGGAHPDYDEPQPEYVNNSEFNLQFYVDFVSAQITELLTQYGPIAAIWLDSIAVPMNPKDQSGELIEGFDPRNDGDPFRCQALYDMIHHLQPQCLVSYKQGYLHTEDFYAPERNAVPPQGKPLEICETMMPQSWGHDAQFDDQHKSADEVMAVLMKAADKHANLLLNTGPLGDGSIHPVDESVLREVGRRIQKQGLPIPTNQG